jgi:methyl-accepting chemotaxis protein
MGISNFLLKKTVDTIYVNVYKYIIVLVACINYFAISMFVPYRDAWGTIILIFFISAYYLELKVTLFGVIVSSAINIFSFYFSVGHEILSTDLPELLIRVQVISFGICAALISTHLGRKLLYSSCVNEFNLNVSLENIQTVNLKVKETVSLLGASSEHITDLSTLQYNAAEITTTRISAILEETINTTSNVQECVKLVNALTNDTTIMKSQTKDAIDNSQKLKQTALIGTNSIGIAVEKIVSIKDSAIRTSDSAREIEERSKNIEAIVKDIQDISEQTNLLSLNATIEAARAGEYGRGFAVVAEAIRNLSAQSQKSLKNISSVISNMNQNEKTVHDLVDRVDEGVYAIRKLDEYYRNIIEGIEFTMKSLDTINQLADNQQNSVSSVNNFIIQVKDMSDVVSQNIEETSASTQQTFASCEELLESAKRLGSMSKELNNTVMNI